MAGMWSGFAESLGNWNTFAIVGRLMLAVLMGTVIGIDRGLKRRGAGIKTHALVCVGAALVMLTSQYMTLSFSGKADMARMGAQVISGVGFLGVGTILVTGKQQVRGLTTAAGLWTCACVGLAIGVGFVEGAVVTLLLIIVILRILNRLDLFLQKHARSFELYLELDGGKSIGLFLQEMRQQNIKVDTIETTKNKIPGKFSTAVFNIEVTHYKMRGSLIDEIRNLDYVHYVEEM